MYTWIAKVDELRSVISIDDDLCDYYLIDRDCNIYSEYSGKILQPIKTESGYFVVSLNTKSGDRIQRRIHRLGMYTFKYFPGCENFQVNHIHGKKYMNNVDNDLEWSTAKENINEAIKIGLRRSWSGSNNPNSKISIKDVNCIVKMVLEGYCNGDIIEQVPNSNNNIINQIVLGNTWKSNVDNTTAQLLRDTRYPLILSIDQKHQLCRYYQDHKCEYNYFGCKKDYINEALYKNNIPITNSTHRMAKRLYYKYQDLNITSLYNY